MLTAVTGSPETPHVNRRLHRGTCQRRREPEEGVTSPGVAGRIPAGVSPENVERFELMKFTRDLCRLLGLGGGE